MGERLGAGSNDTELGEHIETGAEKKEEPIITLLDTGTPTEDLLDFNQPRSASHEDHLYQLTEADIAEGRIKE